MASQHKSSKEFPFEIEILDPEKGDQDFKKHLEAYDEEFIRIGPKKYVLQTRYLSEAANIYNFSLRPDDIFVVTFPKSGTTFTQELVWLVCNDFDYTMAKSKKLIDRFPFLEMTTLHLIKKEAFTEEQEREIKQSFAPLNVQEVAEMPSPRFIKSHLPLSLLPESLLNNTKVIYVARDPRDAAVSFFYHNRLMKLLEPDATMKSFWKIFVTNNIIWGPYFEHVLEAWEKRNHPNMLFLFYEELTQDLPGVIQRVANFFGKTVSDDQLEGLIKHLHIDNFKKNSAVNFVDMQKVGLFTNEGGFIRKGKVGDWRNHFDEEMTAEAEEWIANNLRGTDFSFYNS